MPLFLRLLYQRLLIRRRGVARIICAWLLLMFSLHTLAMVMVEGMSLQKALWLTIITATTIGYGDAYAATPLGQIATVAFIITGTVFVLPVLAGHLIERAAERARRRERGLWDWKLHMHILIISTTATETTNYLVRLIQEIRKDSRFAQTPIQLLTHAYDTTGLPVELTNLDVVFVSGDGDSPEELERAAVKDAVVVVVLGGEAAPKSDAYVFDTVTRAREAGYTGRIVAECLSDRNRPRLCTSPHDVAIRPARGYPEILASAILSPGSEHIIEDFFTQNGRACVGIELGHTCTVSWKTVAQAFLDHDLGLLVGAKNGPTVFTAPRANEMVTFDTLYAFIPPEEEDRIRHSVINLLAGHSPSIADSEPRAG